MPDLRHCGFFHLDPCQPGDPVELLEDALSKSGQEALFAEALVVLPEAFNIKDYFGNCELDPRANERLKDLSERLHLCFVVGLVRDDETRYNEAVLIDSAKREVLSRKILPDTSTCYKPFREPSEDEFVDHRNVNIGSLICRDATDEGDEKQQIRHKAIIKKFEDFAKEGKAALLCVPARFSLSVPILVANLWGNASIVIANCGGFRYPSVLRFEDGQTCVAPTDGRRHVHLAPLPLPRTGK